MVALEARRPGRTLLCVIRTDGLNGGRHGGRRCAKEKRTILKMEIPQVWGLVNWMHGGAPRDAGEAVGLAWGNVDELRVRNVESTVLGHIRDSD